MRLIHEMLESLNQAAKLSTTFGAPIEDVLLIALNASGLATQMMSSRMRLRLRLNSCPDQEFRLILATNRALSPFKVEDDILFLNSEPIARVREFQDDTAVIGYFRRDGTVITLNSKSRSHCTGCLFCPNTLEGAGDRRQTTKAELVRTLRVLAKSRDLGNLSSVVEVNLSTGCFGGETETIEHLRLVRHCLDKMNCDAQIGLLSSEIRSDEAFSETARAVGPIQLILTVECFSNREAILKASKASLSPDQMPALLARAKNNGHDTSITYIVGLDEPDVAIDRLSEMKPQLTRFPNFQVYQPHNSLMDIHSAASADALSFYLSMRRRLEDLLDDTDLKPESWSNYRPLWYFEFRGEPLTCIRA